MRLIPIIFAALAMLIAGCASTETVKEARGQGVSRTYGAGYDAAYDAVLAAAKTRELEVVESDKSSGRVILSHGITWLSWGERIAIFVKSSSPRTTEVEIVSKPVLAPLNFPPDWEKILLDQIAAELSVKR